MSAGTPPVSQSTERAKWVKSADWEDWKRFSVAARPLFANEKRVTDTGDGFAGNQSKPIAYRGTRSLRINHAALTEMLLNSPGSQHGETSTRKPQACSSRSCCQSPASDGAKSMELCRTPHTHHGGEEQPPTQPHVPQPRNREQHWHSVPQNDEQFGFPACTVSVLNTARHSATHWQHFRPCPIEVLTSSCDGQHDTRCVHRTPNPSLCRLWYGWQDSSSLQTYTSWKCKTTPSYRRELSLPQGLLAIDTGDGDHEVTQKTCNDLCQKWALHLISGKWPRTQNVEHAQASYQVQKNNSPALPMGSYDCPLQRNR